ncbi:MAG: hypothetical protein J5I90_02790 [Caldilineales bacterium]|nr:hypothetical protein [Caldilineales bacterium]
MRIISLVIGAIAGGIVFLYYFLPSPVLSGLAQPLLDLVVILAAAGLLFAGLHLLGRHAARAAGSPLSLVVVAAFLATFIASTLPGGFSQRLGEWIYRWLLAPGLAATFALLPIFLAYALYRRARVRELGMLLFLLSFIVVLLGQLPYVAETLPALAEIRHSLLTGMTAAVFRGILIGMAVAIILALFSRLRSDPGT